MVKLNEFEEKIKTGQRVLENIKYTKSLTDDQLRTKLNNERIGLKDDNMQIFDKLEMLGDPLVQKVDSYLEDVDQHCGDVSTAWQMDVPNYRWLQRIKDRTLTEKEYEGMMNGTEPIREYTTIIWKSGKPEKTKAKEYLRSHLLDI